MMQLFIDGRRAAIAEGTTIKVTRENPLFTDAGTYTLEVALPMAGCAENRRIFGPIHRPDVSMAETAVKRFACKLIAPPLEIEGKARVISVSNEDVKVQILAGRSELNDIMKDAMGKEKYIDELAFSGRLFEKAYAQVTGDQAAFVSYQRLKEFFRAGRIMHDSRPGDEECTALPIYSSTDGRVANELAYVRWFQRGKKIEESFGHVVYDTQEVTSRVTAPPKVGERSGGREDITYDENYVFAPQPFLIAMVKRVFRALGLELANEDNGVLGTWMERLIIANCRPTLDYADILPHWTVAKFVEEIQNFFGVVVQLEGRKVKLVRKEKLYRETERTHVIEEIVDEFSATIEENERRKDAAGANVVYKFPEVEPVMQIPEDVCKKANRKYVWWLVQVDNYLSAKPQMAGEWQKANLVMNLNTGFRYAFLKDPAYDNWSKRQIVDPMGGRFVRPAPDKPSDEADVELHIVPVQAAVPKDGIPMHAFLWDKKDYKHMYVDTTPEAIMATKDTVQSVEQETWTIQNAVFPRKDKKEAPAKRDVIEVAYLGENMVMMAEWINKDNEKRLVAMPTACGNPFYTEQEEVKTRKGASYKLMLNFRGLQPDESPAPEGESGMRNTVLDAYKPANTAVQYVFSFIDKGNFEPEDVFIIRGRRFLCRKLEYNVTERGTERLIKGYFHEME